MTGSGNNFKSCRGTEVTRFNPCRQNFKQTKRFTASYFLVSTWKDLLFDVSVIDVIERNYEIWARVEGKLIRMTMDNRRPEEYKLGPQLRITNIGDLKLCFNIIFWLRYFLLRVKVLYRLVKIKREKKIHIPVYELALFHFWSHPAANTLPSPCTIWSAVQHWSERGI